MATLTGLQIDASYLGLIKTTDNAALTGTAKVLTDGAGNSLNMEVATGGVINFPSGTVDFTGATVSGIPGALRAGSLTTDNFPNNFRNIVTTGGTPSSSTAYGWQSMAFGHGCSSISARSIAIGIGAVAGDYSAGNGGTISMGWDISNTGHRSIAIGSDVTNRILASADDQISIGMLLDNNSEFGILIGNGSNNLATAGGIGIGQTAVVNANDSICIGKNVNDSDAARVKAISIGNDLSTAQRTVNIGVSQNAFGADGVCIGSSNSFGGNYNVAVGYNNAVGSGGEGQVVIGKGSSATGNGSVAIGDSVTASKAQTVAVVELETKLIGGGITMISPDGTEYKLTVANGGTLVIT